nr:ribosomal protein S6 kinase-like 1 isoform X18 [Manis javanica]
MSLSRCHAVSRERQTIIPRGVPYMTKLLRYFMSEDSIFLHLEHVQGGTLWSHLLSQAHPPQSGPRSGSSLERMKAPLNASVSFRAPALLPRGHTRLQDRIPLKPPWISQSLPPNRGAPHISPQREAGGEPPARTHTSYPSELPKAPSGPQHLQARQGPGQRLDMGPSWGLPWVQEGAAWVLGGYGHGRGQSHPSMDGGNLGLSGGAWNVQEEQVKQWAAETLVALEALHEQGVLCRDLNPRNLLLDQAGHIRLTYFGQWSEVEPQCCREALDNLYSAPEVGGISELTEACDWWSFGSLLYELLTGMRPLPLSSQALSQSHPSGIQAHTQLQLPEWLSRPAASLLTELLQFDPTRRLGAGGDGINKLKSHPFFSTTQWSKLVGAWGSYPQRRSLPQVWRLTYSTQDSHCHWGGAPKTETSSGQRISGPNSFQCVPDTTRWRLGHCSPVCEGLTWGMHLGCGEARMTRSARTWERTQPMWLSLGLAHRTPHLPIKPAVAYGVLASLVQ